MAGYVTNIERDTLENDDYRRVLFTGKNTQLVLMTLRPGEEIGLETHEDPYIVAGNNTVIRPGMAFSIEPGFYRAGQYGARIEDIVVATEDGLDVLNRTSRDLVTLD